MYVCTNMYSVNVLCYTQRCFVSEKTVRISRCRRRLFVPICDIIYAYCRVLETIGLDPSDVSSPYLSTIRKLPLVTVRVSLCKRMTQAYPSIRACSSQMRLSR